MKRRTKLPKLRKGAWFVPLRGSYLPATWQGWILYIPYGAYIITSFVMIAESDQSLTVKVMTLVPYWVSGLVVMTWIAKQKS